MLIRYPDSPMLSHASALPSLRDTEWLGEFKMDGWRCIIQLDGSPFMSRHNKPLPVSQLVKSATIQALHRAKPGSIFDSEWLGRRDGQSERIVVFDIIRDGYTWLTDMRAQDRFALLLDLVPLDLIVPHTWCDYRNFFEASRRPGVEGIVLKHVDSKYTASVRGCAENRSWWKIRHRAGDNGQVRVA